MSVTRATTATRVNSAGLIELVPYNLLEYSEQFDNAYWSKYQTSVTANSTTAPNGTTTADTITITGAGGGTVYKSSFSFSGGVVCVSVYFKKGTTNLTFVEGNPTSGYFGAGFDLDTEVITPYSSLISSNIENLNNGWYRCSIVANASGSGYVAYGLSGSVGQTCYAWGAQLNEGTIKPYQKTETKLNIPRLDYSNGTCPSLLVEPQRTNLYTYSEDLSQWLTYSSITTTANSAISPSGIQNADRVQFGTNGSLIYRTGTGSSGSNTLSVWAKATSGTSSKFRFFANGATLLSNDLEATNEWQRFEFTYTYSAQTAGLSAPSTGASDVLFWGFQHELGSYATSYIPTTSASVTRNADEIFKTGISSLIGQTEGVWYLDLFASAENKDAGTYATWLIAGDATNNFQIYNLGTTLYWYAKNAGGVLIDQTANETLVKGQRYKIAFAYKGGDYALYINGVQKRTSTNANVPTVSQFNLSAEGYGASAAIVKNEYNAVALWKTRLTNTQLATLTTI
jgi:hypothetical protein